MNRNKQTKFLHVNASWHILVPYGSNCHFPAAQQKPCKKSLTLNKKCLRVFWRKEIWNNCKTQRARGEQED